VHGNFYGTSVAGVEKVIAEGKICILDIDVQVDHETIFVVCLLICSFVYLCMCRKTAVLWLVQMTRICNSSCLRLCVVLILLSLNTEMACL